MHAYCMHIYKSVVRPTQIVVEGVRESKKVGNRCFRAYFSRQFLLDQWPSQFLFLFLISSSIVLPSPTLSSTTAFFILSVHFTRFMLLHIHILNASCCFCSFRRSVQVSVPYNATLHTKLFTILCLSFFFPRASEKASVPVKSVFCHCHLMLYFLTAVQVKNLCHNKKGSYMFIQS